MGQKYDNKITEVRHDYVEGITGLQHDLNKEITGVWHDDQIIWVKHDDGKMKTAIMKAMKGKTKTTIWWKQYIYQGGVTWRNLCNNQQTKYSQTNEQIIPACRIEWGTYATGKCHSKIDHQTWTKIIQITHVKKNDKPML